MGSSFLGERYIAVGNLAKWFRCSEPFIAWPPPSNHTFMTLVLHLTFRLSFYPLQALVPWMRLTCFNALNVDRSGFLRNLFKFARDLYRKGVIFPPGLIGSFYFVIESAYGQNLMPVQLLNPTYQA